MTNEQFLTLLEQARLNKGLSIVEFAALLGISYDTYYRWKRGEQPKTIATFLTIINFCQEEHLL